MGTKIDMSNVVIMFDGKVIGTASSITTVEVESKFPKNKPKGRAY